MARHLEQLGFEVIVADPGFAPMYATRDKKIKNDKRDACTLAQAAKLGAYKAAHRLSDAQRLVRTELQVRQSLVQMRTKLIFIKTLFSREVFLIYIFHIKNICFIADTWMLSDPLIFSTDERLSGLIIYWIVENRLVAAGGHVLYYTAIAVGSRWRTKMRGWISLWRPRWRFGEMK